MYGLLTVQLKMYGQIVSDVSIVLLRHRLVVTRIFVFYVVTQKRKEKMMNELNLQEVADLFGCYACVNKYEEDRILLFDRYPYYNKDSGVYGGRCIGWVSNQDKVAIPMVATPRVIRRPGVRNLINNTFVWI